MSYWILPATGKPISRTTVQHLTSNEADRPHIIQQINDYHQELDKKLGDEHYINSSEDFEVFLNEDVPEIDRQVRENEEPYLGYNLPEIDLVGGMEDETKAEDTYDKCLGVEVSLPGPGDKQQIAKAIRKL